MKKILLATALVALTSAAASAQGFTYGLKAGANYANVWGKNAPESNGYKIGAVGGLAVNYAFNDLASLQIEALYSNKGYKVTDAKYFLTGADGQPLKVKAEGQQTINYVDMPILVRISTGMLFFEAGPQVGLLVNSKLKSDYKVKNDATGDVITERNAEADQDAIIGYSKVSRTTGGIPSFDIGLVAGVGYNITPALTFGVRYNAGVKTLVDTKNTEAGNEPRIFNEAFQAQLGFMFGGTQ